MQTSLPFASKSHVLSLPGCLGRVLAVKDCADPQALEFCTLMGLEPQWVQLLSVLQLRFHSGQLFVASAFQGDPDLPAMVTTAVLRLWRFRSWSASRWCGILQSARCLIGAEFVGLRDVVRQVIADPRLSNYYIGGFQNLTTMMIEASCITCACGHVTERCLASFLKDDRVAKRLDIWMSYGRKVSSKSSRCLAVAR